MALLDHQACLVCPHRDPFWSFLLNLVCSTPAGKRDGQSDLEWSHPMHDVVLQLWLSWEMLWLRFCHLNLYQPYPEPSCGCWERVEAHVIQIIVRRAVTAAAVVLDQAHHRTASSGDRRVKRWLEQDAPPHARLAWIVHVSAHTEAKRDAASLPPCPRGLPPSHPCGVRDPGHPPSLWPSPAQAPETPGSCFCSSGPASPWLPPVAERCRRL